eukprot:2694309-Rhodomonas_salina.5
MCYVSTGHGEGFRSPLPALIRSISPARPAVAVARYAPAMSVPVTRCQYREQRHTDPLCKAYMQHHLSHRNGLGINAAVQHIKPPSRYAAP